MDSMGLLTLLVPMIGTLLGIWVGKRIDYKGLLRKTSMENKDNIYAGWQNLYDAQKQENEDLKREYTELKGEISLLQKKFDDFKDEFLKKQVWYEEKIDKLEKHNYELVEENTYLKTKYEGDISDEITE